MKIQITYALNTNPDQQLEDLLRWPDLTTLDEVQPHVTAYLDRQYGAGQYMLVGVEEIA